jgi:hypothetical protein
MLALPLANTAIVEFLLKNYIAVSFHNIVMEELIIRNHAGQ